MVGAGKDSRGMQNMGGVEKKKSAAAKHRCGHCRKRLSLVYFTCRCGADLCAAHLAADQHLCTFDFKAAARERIRLENPVVEFEKVSAI